MNCSLKTFVFTVLSSVKEKVFPGKTDDDLNAAIALALEQLNISEDLHAASFLEEQGDQALSVLTDITLAVKELLS